MRIGPGPARRLHRPPPPSSRLAASGARGAQPDRRLETRQAAEAERAERGLLGGRNAPGRLVRVSDGAPGAGSVITVHGINASPRAVQPLTDAAVRSGARTSTFAYDDRYRSQGDSARDLAGALARELEQNRHGPLRVEAHSMGGRIALSAIDQLARAGKLDGRGVRLDLIAPPLAGFPAANWATRAPDWVPNVAPSKDMGTRSEFQRSLERIRLPENVQVRVAFGRDDRVADARNPAVMELARRLTPRVDVLPGDHDQVVAAAAARRR